MEVLSDSSWLVGFGSLVLAFIYGLHQLNGERGLRELRDEVQVLRIAQQTASRQAEVDADKIERLQIEMKKFKKEVRNQPPSPPSPRKRAMGGHELRNGRLATNLVTSPATPRVRKTRVGSADSAMQPKCKIKIRLPENCEHHFFLSHAQHSGGDQVATLEMELLRLGFMCW
jgi:hypothetical protein